MCSSRASLEDRLKLEEYSGTSNMADTAVGSKQLSFTLKKVNCSCDALSSVCPVKLPPSLAWFKAAKYKYENVLCVNQLVQKMC